MIHTSGFTYEGLWVNGKPAQWATKMVIVGVDSTVGITITQGQGFQVHVQMVDDDGEVVKGLVCLRIDQFLSYSLQTSHSMSFKA